MAGGPNLPGMRRRKLDEVEQVAYGASAKKARMNYLAGDARPKEELKKAPPTPAGGLGEYKLLLYPLTWAIAAVCAPSPDLLTHVLLATVARYAVNHGFTFLTQCHGLAERYRIIEKNPPAEQLTRELDWDNPLVGSAMAFLAVQLCTPWLCVVHEFSWRSLGMCAVGHYLIVEPLYYLYHVALHWPKLYKFTHSHHHSSVITQPVSGTSHPFWETVGYLATFSFPILVPAWFGCLSYEIIYIYFIFFDIMNCIGHCNFEVVPVWLQRGPLKYLFYCSSYHSLHHTRYKFNYCLFCPFWDHLFGTVAPETYTLQRSVRMKSGPKPASVVFLGHGFAWNSILSTPMISPYLSTQSRDTVRAWMYPLFPVCLLAAAVCRAFKWSCFVVQRYGYKGVTCATWTLPVLAYNYARPGEWAYLNWLLLRAIRDAEAQGATHVGLGALNKAQFLNNGGADLVARLPADCRVKVVHGNTLTAAVVYQKVRRRTEPSDEIFFTGATSTVGTAVVLRLFRDGYAIRVLTRSAERFGRLVALAGPEGGRRLVRAERYEEGSRCRTWVLGSPLTGAVGHMVPKGCAFLEFAVPGSKEELAYPHSIVNVGSVQVKRRITDLTFCHFREQGSVPACLAAAIIHGVEGFKEHEVQEVDVNQLDQWLELAKKHEFGLE